MPACPTRPWPTAPTPWSPTGTEADHRSALHPELCPAHVAAPFTRLERDCLLPGDAELVAVVDGWLAQERASGDFDRLLAAAQREP